MISIPETQLDSDASQCPVTGAVGARPPKMAPVPRLWPEPQRISAEAHEYLCLLEREGILSAEGQAARMGEIEDSVARSGSYWQTSAELEHGAKVAWRNSARCIGRLYWNKLMVRDLRHLDSAEGVFEALVDHLRTATNGGKIQSMISVFAQQEPGSPGIRIWNPQLVRYAGYRRKDGTVLGDPLQVEFTELVRRLGWNGGAETPFDILPIVVQMPGEEPKLFELPPDAVLEVPLSHPEYPWFEELGLKWHALPVISSMRMEIGGISYSAAPFNGWYMGTEIGARNLADQDRYDMLPVVARCMGLDTRSNRRLWRDRAMVELNVAVLHSFQEAGVTVIDHHTAAKHFIRHEEFERQADRPLPAEWSWIVPPVSGAATEVFHREYHETLLKPNYFYQANAWEGFFPAQAHPRRDVQTEQTDRDGLTGLIHRGALDRRLVRFGRQGGVIAILDLDDFSEINEKHGQSIGNLFLRAAAQTVVGTVRPDDTCARYGGDSFCFLLEGVETDSDAEAVASRIRSALAKVHLDELPSVGLKASIGMTFVEAGSDVLHGVRRADEASRRAKAEGGDRSLLVTAPSVDEPELPAVCPFTGATAVRSEPEENSPPKYASAASAAGYTNGNGNGQAPHQNGNGASHAVYNHDSDGAEYAGHDRPLRPKAQNDDGGWADFLFNIFR